MPLGWASVALRQWSVVDVFAARASMWTHGAVGQRQPPQLVCPSHGDVEDVLVVGQIPRTAERDLRTWSRGAAVVSLLARAGHGVHDAGAEVDAADGVVLGVGYVEGIAHQLHPLWVVEGRGGITAVCEALGAGSNCGLRLSVQIGDHDAVVVGVGDEQAVARAVGQNLAGEGQGRVLSFLRRQAQVASVDQALFVEFGDHTPQQVIESLVGQLAFMFADDLSLGGQRTSAWARLYRRTAATPRTRRR